MYPFRRANMISQEKYERNKKLLVTLTAEQTEQLNEIEREAVARFSGSISVLTSALGFLRIGHQVGWRVLVLTHNKRTIRKYEDILGIKTKEFFPETSPGAKRSIGLKMADALGNFWKAVSGDVKIDDRREIS